MRTKNLQKALLISLASFLFYVFFPSPAYAQVAPPPPPLTGNEPWFNAPFIAFGSTTTDTISRLTNYINGLLILSGTVCVIFLILGGYYYVISSGDEEKSRRAKRIIIFSVIGIVIVGISGIAINALVNIPISPVTPATF